jgi:hypothetical protein
VDDGLLGQLGEAGEVDVLGGLVERSPDLARSLFSLDGRCEIVCPPAELVRALLDRPLNYVVWGSVLGSGLLGAADVLTVMLDCEERAKKALLLNRDSLKRRALARAKGASGSSAASSSLMSASSPGETPMREIAPPGIPGMAGADSWVTVSSPGPGRAKPLRS